MIDANDSFRRTIVVKHSAGWLGVKPKELFHYRELLYFLTWRDIKIRYKQTVLGAAWSILQPLMTMVIFTIFFGKIAGISSDGAPYPIFSYAGLLPWMYCANAVSLSSNSLVASGNMIQKVYFPRMLVPISGALAGLVDYLIALSILVGMMLYYRIAPGPQILLLPLLMVLAFLASTGVGLWLSAMNVRFRDVKYTVPFLIQLWLFLTPVIYPSSLLPAGYRWVLAFNPMTAVVEGHRAVILGTGFEWRSLLISLAVTLAVLSSGAMYFKRMERSFADVI
jgi:lipopolysaccharide transport system permease protein